MSCRRILISGAGVAGPALAWWLLQYGFEPTIVEKAPEPRTGGYMIDFWGVGYDVAERMGILPAVLQAGYQIEEVRLVDTTGHRIGGLEAKAFGRAAGGRFTSILRSDLARIISEALAGRVETIFGDTIQTIQQDTEGVDVTFARAAPRRFDLVIGADGLHSAVRAITFGDEHTFEHPLGYLVAAFSTTDYPHTDRDIYVSYCRPGGQIARYALRGGRTAFLIVMASQAHALARGESIEQKRAVRDHWAGAGWESDDMLRAMEAADDFYFDSVSQIRMSEWSRGRVTLVGDAAFCPSLLAGQGSAFAMAGAYLLAGELAAAGGDFGTAFARYQAQFKPFVERKQRGAVRLGGWFAPRTPFGVWVRNKTTGLMNLPMLSSVLLNRAFADRFELPEYVR